MSVRKNLEKFRRELEPKLSAEKSVITALERIESGSFTDENGGFHTNLPPFTRVAVVSRPGSGSYIKYEIWMPDTWNEILVGAGNSGMAGVIHYEVLANYISRGYVAVHTDLGTSLHYKYFSGEFAVTNPEEEYQIGINNPDLWKDFGWRATHIMTVQGKEILRTFYGKSQKYAYFEGGSQSGKEGLALAQRFPEDYDGIFAYKAANNCTNLHAYRLWNQIHATTQNRKPLFAQEDAERLTECAVEFLGQEGDNFVTYPWQDKNTAENFLTFVQKKYPQFTPEQIEALRAIYNGPVNPVTGEQIYNGMPIGAEIYSHGIFGCQSYEKTADHYPLVWALGKDWDPHNFDFAKDMDRVHDLLAEDLDANVPDLNVFAEKGGKLLLYSGASDPAVPHPDIMDYYNRVSIACGGYEKTKTFCRFFLMPGMAHCGEGNGARDAWGNQNGMSMLRVLRRWREEGIEPETLTGVRGVPGELEFVRNMPYYKAELITGDTLPPCCCDRYRK